MTDLTTTTTLAEFTTTVRAKLMISPSAISNVLAHALRNLSDQAVMDQFGNKPLVRLLLKYRQRSRTDLPFTARCQLGDRYARAFRIICGYREPTRRIP